MTRFQKTLLVSTLVLAPVADAGETLTEVKQGLSFTTAGVAGAIAGGPVGMVLGALGGAWVGEQFKKADELPQTLGELDDAKLVIGQLESSLASEQSQSRRLRGELNQQIAASGARLEFEVLFRTGEDALQSRDQERIDMLAVYLTRNPDLKIRLDGYADPRGSEEYNNVLAQYRAQAVADALIASGISSARVSMYHHGADASTAAAGDYDAYARARRVNIEVYSEAQSVAQNH